MTSRAREDVVDSIGGTPIQRLRLDEQAVGRCFSKLELANPFGMKDRAAREIILAARRSGQLREGAAIIESSSGSMALSVALVGTALGHPVIIVTDPRIDPLTRAKLEGIGCTVHVVERMTTHGWQSARLELLEVLMDRDPLAFWPRQYDNPDNPRAYAGLAAELLEDLGSVDVLVSSVGSGGSLCGTARALREVNPQLRVIGVDAVGSVIFEQPDRPARLQSGLGNSLVPNNVDMSVIDEVHWLSDAEAFAATRLLLSCEKVFAGNSSGSAYLVARWVSRHIRPDMNIVVIFPDRGDRYVDTVYSDEFAAAHGLSLVAPETPQAVPYRSVVESWSYATLPRA